MKIIKDLGFETLPMMTQFIYDLDEHTDDDDRFSNETLAYRNFITQSLTLSQFVPCKDGVPMEEPPKWSESWSFERKQEVSRANEEYQQAVDAVIFEAKEGKFKALSDGNIAHLGHRRIYMAGTIEQAINLGVKLKLK
jgi:hypothetical protein